MGRSIAYLTLQATREGQAAHAHVHEIIAGLRELGWSVDLFEPEYAAGRTPGALTRLREFRRIQSRLRRHIAEFDAVYVRAHFLARPTARAARRAGVPVVQECNGPYEDLLTAWPATRVARPLFEHLQRDQYRTATATVAVTPELADFVNREGQRQDTVVIPNGANTDLFRPDLEPLPGLPERYVIFFGALAPWQGIDTMLSAAAHPEWPTDVALVIAGDGAMRARVEAAATNNPRVVYAGAIPYAEMPRAAARSLAALIIKDSDQHAVSGLSPLKLYESMAAGVPVIVSDMPGLADTVRACKCGVVIAPGDDTALASAVEVMAADAERVAAMGRAGRMCAEREYSWRKAAERTAAVIESAAGGA